MALMLARFVLVLLLAASAVASGLLLANAQKIIPPEAVAQAKSSSAASSGAASSPVEKGKTEVKPAGKAVSPPSEKKKLLPLPLLMELRTSRDLYRPKDDIMVNVELWAIQPVTLCLYPDHPEANFAVDAYRAGFGKIEVPPNVVQLETQDLRHIERISLAPGQMHRTVFNIKKLVPLPPAFWKTGEYRMQVKFFLCGKTEQAETIIPAQGPLHLLVLE